MTLLTRATQVASAVKNVGRMREIVGAMTRFGFGTLVDRVGLRRYKTVDSPDGTQRTTQLPFPVRVRLLFEELGPAFIKIGQVMAGRPDLVPEDLAKELEALQDQAAPVNFLDIKPMLEAELERTLDLCYSSFDTEPLASASIAQVHAARTLDGDDVVVKIQKPDVEKLLRQDLEILDMFVALAENYIPELRPFRPRWILDEFKRSLMNELDFAREANNIRRFRENFANSQFLVIPKVFSDLSSARVITMQRLRGVKLSDVTAVRAMGIDPHELLRQGIDHFYQSIMVNGFFHGDPHGGNILVLPDGRMGLIDFGSVGRLSQKSKDAIINMFLALVAEDYDALVWEYLQLSPAAGGKRSSDKLEAIQAEVNALFGPYHGLPIKDIPAGKLLMEGTGVAFRHHITLPGDLVMVFKAIMLLEGIGRTLDPDFDLTGAGSRYAKQLLKNRYNPRRLLKDTVFVARDMLRFLQIAPRQLSETLRQIECGELTVNIKINDLEKHTKAQAQASAKISFAILSVGLLMTSAYVSNTRSLPLEAQLSLWAVSLSAAGLCFLKNFRS